MTVVSQNICSILIPMVLYSILTNRAYEYGWVYPGDVGKYSSFEAEHKCWWGFLLCLFVFLFGFGFFDTAL